MGSRVSGRLCHESGELRFGQNVDLVYFVPNAEMSLIVIETMDFINWRLSIQRFVRNAEMLLIAIKSRLCQLWIIDSRFRWKGRFVLDCH